MLIVVANAKAARFFVRKGQEEPIVELIEFAESADLLDLHGERFSSLRRIGGRTMVKTRNQRRQEELQLFLRRVADQADRAVAEQGCETIAIFAPPPVLNALRDQMDDRTRGKLSSELCADLVNAQPAAVDQMARSMNV